MFFRMNYTRSLIYDIFVKILALLQYTQQLRKESDPRDLREKKQDESTEVICAVKRQIPIPDVCSPLLNFSMTQILMRLRSSIIDSGCSSVPRIIIISKEKICPVYTNVTNDEFTTVSGKESLDH